MRLLVFMALLAFWSCGQNTSGKEEKTVNKDSTSKKTGSVKTTPIVNDPLPATTPEETVVNERLKARFGNKWHVLNDKEAKWMKDAFDYFIVPKRKENPGYPYIAKGDFNADGKADIAAVVTDNLKKKYQIAILTGAATIMLWDEDVLANAAISTMPRSVIEGMDGGNTKKIKLKADGINVEYFERASFVIYWSGTAFKKIQTGD